ncbi:MAG: hypothetical protein FD143_1428 [Ignavibacteria bacterium]|nr:MAG: hypothetical protein FD143_1428 [Ignavibacteria bacterium]
MKRTFPIFVLLAFTVNAQSYFDSYTYKNTSLDVTTNPASIVMGESFVANRNSFASFIENPANLNAKSKTGLFYNIRYQNWNELAKRYQFSTAGAVLNSSFAVIGIAYSQFTSGLTSFNVFSPTETIEDANQTLSLSISKNITSNLTFGVSAKLFGHSRTSAPGTVTGLDSKSALLFDIGALYSIELNENDAKNNFNLNFGAALQNFGTDYKEMDNLLVKNYRYIRLPKYLKLGFAFETELRNSSGSSDIEAVVTGQYKWLANPLKRERTDVDYWGLGAEFTIKEIFAARAGFFQTPEYWIIYDRAEPLFRYGFGIKIPLQKIGINLPFVLLADYSLIPINDISISTFNKTDETKKLLRAIGITLKYGSSLF